LRGRASACSLCGVVSLLPIPLASRRMRRLLLVLPLFLAAGRLGAQGFPVDLCQLPYRTLPSPSQVATLFHRAGLEEGAATATDSLVEIVNPEEVATLSRELPEPSLRSGRSPVLYRYGMMVARLLLPQDGPGCSLTLFGPPPTRTRQLDLTVITGD
jgi:hypothetical protein